MNIDRRTFSLSQLRILETTERLKLVVLLLIGIVSALLDVAVVALVLPVIRLVTDPISSTNNFVLRNVFRLLNTHELRGQLIVAFSILFVVYLLRTLFAVFRTHIQATFRQQLYRRLGTDLFTRYISNPFEFHLSTNSGDLIRNIYGVHSFLNNYVFAVITIISEVTMLLLIAVLLFVVSPVVAGIVIIFSSISTLILFASTSHRLKRSGDTVRELTGRRLVVLQEAFQGIKEIKVFSKERYFIKRYDHFHNRTLEGERRYEVITGITGPIFEMIMIGGLVAAVSTITIVYNDPTQIFPIVSLFAVSAFRFVPSFGRIIHSYQNIDFGSSMSKVISDDMERGDGGRIPLSSEERISFETKLELRNLSFQYPSRNRPTLTSVNFAFDQGKCYGVIGESGSGKTTLINILLGLLVPTSGSVEIDGVDLQDCLHAWRSTIGYVPQDIFLIDGTIKENVAFGVPSADIDEQLVLKSLNTSELLKFVQNLPLGIETNVGENGVSLSGGQRQRLGIARALYRQPSVLILDEVTSALDADTEKEIVDAVLKLREQLTIIIVTHRPRIAAMCDETLKILP